mgnify:CR=1 FL=1
MGNVQKPRGRKRKNYRGIGLKVGFVVAVMQIISVVLVLSVCVSIFDTMVARMLRERCTNGTNVLEYELSRASEGQDMNEMLDGLKSRMGCEFTIFEGDMRKYSTVMQDGERVVGTPLAPELSAIVIEKSEAYVGEAEIAGNLYRCSYVPTKDENGNVTGLIFAGISEETAQEETATGVKLSILAGAIAILISIILLAIYIRLRVSRPLGKITGMAEELETGDLGLESGIEVKAGVYSNDEIGELGRIFEATIRRMRVYIGEIGDVLGSIADGNLTHDAVQEYVGDFQSIKESLDSIQGQMNNTMGQITASASQISVGSDQVSSSAQVLAQGATQQASAVEEISATVSDISQNSKRTSEAAAEVGEYVNKAGAQLGVSMEYVKELNDAMENISNSSQEISTIISTIENIAFQINILALNASVEAARAGTAGKGFAVVAEEVSNLASKSDEAAKATKELIEDSIVAVTKGSQVVNNVTDSLNQTHHHAGNVTSQMSVVVEAVEKQTVALSQLTEGMNQISAVVQTNSATSEECAAASEELSSQASLLKNLMSSFKLKLRR